MLRRIVSSLLFLLLVGSVGACATLREGPIGDPNNESDEATLLGTIADVPFTLREATAFQTSEPTGPHGQTTTLTLHLHDHVGFCSQYAPSETARGSMSITITIAISRDTTPDISPTRYDIGGPPNWQAPTITTVRAHATRADALTCANDLPSTSREAKSGTIEILRIDSQRVAARFDLDFDGDRIHGELGDVATCASPSPDPRRQQRGCGE